jgi:hypothetical protein
MFGYEDAVNITDEEYNYNDGFGGLYLFYARASADDTAASPALADENKTDTEKTVSAEAGQADAGAAVDASDNEVKGAPAAGSVLGSGSLVMTGVLSAAGGALICFLLMRKRRS